MLADRSARADGAVYLYSVAFTRSITPRDNFIMRPDEFGAAIAHPVRPEVYVGSRDGRMIAMDDQTGKVVWEQPLGGAISSIPVLTSLTEDPRIDPLLLVGTDNGELIAIDLDGPRIRWRYRTDGRVRNRPVIFEGVVFFVNSRDQVFALDLRSGNWRWQYEQDFQTDFTVYGHAGVTFIPRRESEGGSMKEPGTILAGFDNGKVAAIGAGSGDALWLASVAPAEGGNFVDCDSTPLVDLEHDHVVVAGQSTGVHSLALEDGTVRWQFPARGVGSVVAGRAGDLIASSSLEGLFALDASGRLLWRANIDRGVVSTPIVVEGTIFVGHSESGLLAFDTETGDLQSRMDFGSGMSGVPTYDAHRKRLFATTNRGVFMALELDAQAASDPSG